MNYLDDISVVNFAKFCAEQMLKYLVSKNVDLTIKDKKALLIKGLDFIQGEDLSLMTTQGLSWSALEMLQESGVISSNNIIHVRTEEKYDKHEKYGFRYADLTDQQKIKYTQCKDKAEAKQRLDDYRENYKKKDCLIM